MGWAGESWMAMVFIGQPGGIIWSTKIFSDNNLVNKSTGDDLADFHVKLPGSSFRWMLVANCYRHLNARRWPCHCDLSTDITKGGGFDLGWVGVNFILGVNIEWTFCGLDQSLELTIFKRSSILTIWKRVIENWTKISSWMHRGLTKLTIFKKVIQNWTTSKNLIERFY
jgi:hypothetical protein